MEVFFACLIVLNKNPLEAEIRLDGESISDVNVHRGGGFKAFSGAPKWSCAAAVSLWLHTPECALETEDTRNMQGFSVCRRQA